MDKDIDIILEEYKTLREELLLHSAQKRQVIIWLTTAYIALTGVILKYGEFLNCDIASTILLLLLIPFISLYQDESDCIGSIASYIENYIEMKLPDLKWTKSNVESLDLPIYKLFLDSIIGKKSIFYLFGILSWLLPYFVFENRCYRFIPTTILIILTIIYLSKILRFLTWRDRRKKETERWQKHFKRK